MDSKSNNTFKSKHVVKKVENFQWNDDESLAENLPSFEVSKEDILECVSIIERVICNDLSADNFDPTNLHGTMLSITMNASLHKILEARYSKEWNLSSRIEAFDKTRSSLQQILSDPERTENINAKINEILPLFHRKKFTIEEIDLHDDALAVDDESCVICVELLLGFEEIPSGCE